MSKIIKKVQAVLVFSIIALLSVNLLIACGSKNESEKTKQTDQSLSIPKYQIIKDALVRFDKAPTFFVLIDSVNLKDAKFKDDIKLIIKDIANKKGGKFSAYICDNADILEFSFKDYTNMISRPLTNTEKENKAIHIIAIFTGQMSTGWAPNTMTFFPATFTSHNKVGKYVENIKYNP